MAATRNTGVGHNAERRGRILVAQTRRSAMCVCERQGTAEGRRRDVGLVGVAKSYFLPTVKTRKMQGFCQID